MAISSVTTDKILLHELPSRSLYPENVQSMTVEIF